MGLGSFFKRNKDKEEEIVESHIDINTDDCNGADCEKCVIACPNNVLIKAYNYQTKKQNSKIQSTTSIDQLKFNKNEDFYKAII